MLNIKEVWQGANLVEILGKLEMGKYFLLAGGTDLFPAIHDGKIENPIIVNLSVLSNELTKVYLSGDDLHIGALATHDELSHNSLIMQFFPALKAACGKVGSAQIRKRGTIGGNIVHASPAADTLPVLVAAGAFVILASLAGQRKILLEDFLLGPGKVDIAPCEVLIEVIIPNVPWLGVYHKLGLRKSLTISVVSVAILYQEKLGWRVAYGAVAAKIKRASHVEGYLAGGECTLEGLEAAVALEINPIDDIRGTATYRKKAAVNITWLTYQNLLLEVK